MFDPHEQVRAARTQAYWRKNRALTVCVIAVCALLSGYTVGWHMLLVLASAVGGALLYAAVWLREGIVAVTLVLLAILVPGMGAYWTVPSDPVMWTQGLAVWFLSVNALLMIRDPSEKRK